MTDYTPEDVHLVALALENAGTALEDLPSYVEVRLAVAALEALAKAGRLLPEDTRWVADVTGMQRRIARALAEMSDLLATLAAESEKLAARVGRWVPVPEPDMSTDSDSSVGAHNEAHSAHTPAAPEEAEPPCGLPRGLCGDDEDCRLPPCQPVPAVPEEEQA